MGNGAISSINDQGLIGLKQKQNKTKHVLLFLNIYLFLCRPLYRFAFLYFYFLTLADKLGSTNHCLPRQKDALLFYGHCMWPVSAVCGLYMPCGWSTHVCTVGGLHMHCMWYLLAMWAVCVWSTFALWVVYSCPVGGLLLLCGCSTPALWVVSSCPVGGPHLLLYGLEVRQSPDVVHLPHLHLHRGQGRRHLLHHVFSQLL